MAIETWAIISRVVVVVVWCGSNTKIELSFYPFLFA